ncbi:uncharacterized protein LOC109606059 [Aethina tumida]|uniref:uncharacterized protein LOC109606059 n=1 Tax=Aethina tumida TaxID=116153 RepID=UPI002148EF4D|nr:uncharacterized protein LOC109606059 [Aethina tumida]
MPYPLGHRGLRFGVGLVRFENSVCITVGNLMGTCYTRRQCNSVSGIASGRCAQNIGVCCVVYRTCGQSSSYNNTYFTNAGFPNPISSGGRCTMTIIKCNQDICQVRIDFLSLTLSQPNPTGVCSTDALQITGGAGPVPIICGENSGQHVYVDFNGNDTIQMTISTAAAASLGRNWNLKVTQIGCDCPTRAPIGCLMYYTAISGTVTSFNYGAAANAIDPTTGLPGTRELVNENYGVCVAMAPGYCSIEWSQATTNSFVVSGSPSEMPGVTLNGDCTSDFVVIPNPVYPNGTSVGTDRFCGTEFPTVITSSKPFVLTVVTNGNETGDNSNIGFALNYRQLPCSTGVNGLTLG